MLNDILRTVYRTEGKVSALEDRLDRVEDRELGSQKVTVRDWLMIAGSVLAVLGALARKIDLRTAVELLLQK